MKVFRARLHLKPVDWDDYITKFSVEQLEHEYQLVDEDYILVGGSIFDFPTAVPHYIDVVNNSFGTNVYYGFTEKMTEEQLAELEKNMKLELKSALMATRDLIVSNYNKKISVLEVK